MTIREEIEQLKKEKNAVILAHYYVRPEVQEIADYVGDSFYLSKVAVGLKEKTIVFCGVSFMGESAKILNPEKTVLMPDMAADCPMAHMASAETIEKIRSEATYIDNPAKGRQLKARVSYLERLQARQCKNPFIENHGYDFTFPEVELPEDFEPDHAPVVISVKDYALSFDRELLKNVSFDIKAGEKVAIVGANGTGKSSMLKDIYESMKSDADRIGYYTQIFDDDPEQLSGGERNIKQLRALCESDAEILFLDEPSSHLDTYAQIALEKAIKEYQGTVLMVTHDFYTVANCADRILLLENGTVREQSGRAYRKSIYKKYFESDIFEAERIRVEKEVRIHALLRDGKWKEAKNVL